MDENQDPLLDRESAVFMNTSLTGTWKEQVFSDEEKGHIQEKLLILRSLLQWVHQNSLVDFAN